jgi:hypothetical protein
MAMTLPHEMRAAGADALAQCFSSSHGEIAEKVYLAMRPLDPEMAELRKDRDDLLRALGAAETFLASQGYAWGEDGKRGRSDPEMDTTGLVIPDRCTVVSTKWLEAQLAELAALRPVVEAAVAWAAARHPETAGDGLGWYEIVALAEKLTKAVRALPPPVAGGELP